MQSKIYLVFFLILSLLVGGVSAAVTQYNSTVGTETVWLFNGTGTISVTIPSNGTAWVFMVGGGGSGGGGQSGAYNGGGGGAGGILNGTITNLTRGNYTIAVGAGGAAVGQNAFGINGSPSTFSSYTAFGGGGGAKVWSGVGSNGLAGGSGGGSARNTYTGGASIQTTQSPLTGYGYAGGNNNADGQGAGGGGAGAVGSATHSSNAAGMTSTITGSSLIYATGGSAASLIAGADGRGGGGGGKDTGGYAGGSGVVIIRFTSGPPESSFVFTLTDTSTGPSSWNWYVTNLIGNNTEVLFSTSQNPTVTLGSGNWLVKLKATNGVGSSNSTTKTLGINLTSPVVYFWNRTS
jgi:hypothetical protein